MSVVKLLAVAQVNNRCAKICLLVKSYIINTYLNAVTY